LPGPIKTTGMVLGRYDYGNTSRIFAFLTPDHGRVSALAKGARRVRGRPGLGGGLDLLSENEILYYPRRSGLAVLAEWAEVSGSAQLGRDPVRFAAAEACAEFARECSVEEQAEPELYRLLLEGRDLAAGAERLVPLALSVTLGMLRVAGFRPRTESCAACGQDLPRRAGGGLLSAAAGGLVCGRCARREAGSVKRETHHVSRTTLHASAVRLSAEGAALLGALVRLEPAAAARLRPSRRAEGELLRAAEFYAGWCLERRMKGLSGLGAIIAGLEAVGCR